MSASGTHHPPEFLGDPDVVQDDVDVVLANLAAPDELHRRQTQAPTGPAIGRGVDAIGREPRNGKMKNQHRRIQQSTRITVRPGILGACQGVRHLLEY